MADPVEIILEFLQRNQFAQAEAAFREELLARESAGHGPGSHSGSSLAASDLVRLRDANGPTLKDAGRVRTPPEKQLYVEYESGKSESQGAVSFGHSHEFAFKNVSPSPEPQAAIPIKEEHPNRYLDGKLQSSSSNLLLVPNQRHQVPTDPTDHILKVEQKILENGNQATSSSNKEFSIPISDAPKDRIEVFTESLVDQDNDSRSKNGFITRNSTSEDSSKYIVMKTIMPISFLKSTGKNEPVGEKWVDASQLNDKRSTEEVESFKKTPSIDDLSSTPKQELNSTRDHDSGELPRLPPVRLYSIDKNMDAFKDAISAAETETSSRSLELSAFKNTGNNSEATIPWSAVSDAQLNLDMPSSGMKRSLTRLSVSQGIVEDMSDQLSGFATPADGQSDRWYPDDYCGSDTWEDDEDPGYHRQPIEDEEWFLANEIDYPSDDERSRHQAEKNNFANSNLSKKLDTDDRSFVEEESYFSGEEYYKLQASSKEACKSKQSIPENSVDQAQPTYTSLYSKHDRSGIVNMSAVNDDGNDYGSPVLDSEELKMARSQPAWEGFMYQKNEVDQTGISWDRNRVEGDGADDENPGSVRSGGFQVSSDIADIGSEVRDSLLGCSSEGDTESVREQELVPYELSNEKIDSDALFAKKPGKPVQVKNAPVQHLDEDDDEREMVLQYYDEEWGHTKRSNDRETKSTIVQTKGKEFAKRSNKTILDNGGFEFEGFSFPSPSSTGDVVGSRAGSGKSIWSNRESTAQAEDTDGYVSGFAGPDNTLAAWKRKSNDSSPVARSGEENVVNANRSSVCLRSADEYVSLEPKEGNEEIDDRARLQTTCQPSAQDEDAAAAEEEMRTICNDEDQYEIFDLRIIHRKNRTGFEEDKDFPVLMNSVVAGRYHVTEYLGSAAFSKAIQAHDLQTGMDVCMKIIKNNKDFFDQSLDEIKLLKFVNKHDPADKHHILRLYDYFYHREHLFIVCELLRANLYEFHKFNRESGGEVYFTMPRLQSISIQILEALEFLHKLGIIHCDLKPENILVKSYSRCEIKIIDLGSSCFQTDHLCSYVQSRSYRAPEVILGLPYDQKIDIWSLGCILAELCTGNVLFQNDSLGTLLARVVGILGPIDPEVLGKGRDTYKYFTKNHMLYERNQETDQLEYLVPKKTSLSHRMPMGDQGFVDFVAYLLQNNPAKRPTASEALQHPWLSYPYEPISS